MAALATLMASTSSISVAEAVVVTVEAAELGLASGEEVELVPSGLEIKTLIFNSVSNYFKLKMTTLAKSLYRKLAIRSSGSGSQLVYFKFYLNI